MPGIVARVRKADGTLAGYGEPGELVIKSPSVPMGYANNVAAFVYSLLDFDNILIRLLQYERNVC